MANLPISGLPAASALDGTELLPFVQGGVTTQANVQDILNADLPITSSGITVSGNIVPSTPQGATLGSIDKPFFELYLQSGSISIESDTPGDPSAIISNREGNLEVSVGGMSLVESGSAFTAPTGSFNKLSADLTENYVWVGDSNNKNIEVPISSLPQYFPFNYGLFNQTGSSIPVTGSGTGVYSSGSLLDGGLGTLTVPANSFSLGDGFEALLTGKLEIANNHTLEIQVKSDDVLLADTGEITMAGVTDKNWRLEIEFSINALGAAGSAAISTAGLLTYRTDSAGDVKGEIFSFVNSSSFDTTINNTLVIEAILGTSTNPNEYIYSEYFTLRKTF